jgi:hypothetical protein
LRCLQQRAGSLPGDKTGQVARLSSKLRSLRAPVALKLALLSQHEPFYTGKPKLTFFLGICITSRATSVSTHLDPMNIFSVVLLFAIKQELFTKTIPFQAIVFVSPAQIEIFK